MRRLVLAAVTAALVFAHLAYAGAASAWTWPTHGAVVQAFSFDRSQPYAAGQHRGVDIAGAEGEPVLAPAAGIVSFAGSVPSSGRSVTIDTADGYAVTLTHLGTILASRRATVREGDAVGTTGSSGDAEVAGPYVHLGIRIASDDQGYVDPLGLLPPRPAPPPQPVTTAPAPTTPAPATPAPSLPAQPDAAPAVPDAGAAAPQPVATSTPTPTPNPPRPSPRAGRGASPEQPVPVRAAPPPAHRAPVPAVASQAQPRGRG